MAGVIRYGVVTACPRVECGRAARRAPCEHAARSLSDWVVGGGRRPRPLREPSVAPDHPRLSDRPDMGHDTTDDTTRRPNVPETLDDEFAAAVPSMSESPPIGSFSPSGSASSSRIIRAVGTGFRSSRRRSTILRSSSPRRAPGGSSAGSGVNDGYDRCTVRARSPHAPRLTVPRSREPSEPPAGVGADEGREDS